jgi:hypothetical protein
MEDDMENYIKYKLIDGNKKLKCCVIPHIFHCQADRKRAVEEVIRNVASKRARTLCSGHIRPLTTHFDTSLLSSTYPIAASP